MIGGLLFGIPVLWVTFMVSEPFQTIFLMLAGAILYSPMGASVTYAQEVAPEHKALVSAMMLGVVWFLGSLIAIGVGALGDVWSILTVMPAAIVVTGSIGVVLSFGLPKENRA